jgi:predicted membrane protein
MMDNYSSGRKSRWVFAARLLQVSFTTLSQLSTCSHEQIVLGASSIGLATTLCVALGSWDGSYGNGRYSESNPDLIYLAIPVVVMSSLITLLGCIGMCKWEVLQHTVAAC